MSEDETIGPLLAARKRIDDTIQSYLDKVAALRKRRDFISGAIDVIRCGDDEIMTLPTLSVSPTNGRKKRVAVFDEKAVEDRILTLLTEKPLAFSQIVAGLDGLEYSIAGVRRIVQTSPKIAIIGERLRTRYSFK